MNWGGGGAPHPGGIPPHPADLGEIAGPVFCLVLGLSFASEQSVAELSFSKTFNTQHSSASVSSAQLTLCSR